MDSIVVTLIVIGLTIGVIAVIAWLLYKANFKAKEIKIKTGVVEATLERESEPDPKPSPPKPQTQASQEATEGGRIEKSTIEAPAASGASLKQKAKGKDSQIKDSGIKLN